jgi:CubicO group peptidase (beta-lactamase class C family)
LNINQNKLDSAIQLLKEGVSKRFFPGAAVVIGSSLGVHRMEHFGNRCNVPKVKPLERSTLFDLASLTKVVATNTLFMVFLEKGLVSVFDRVGNYINGFDEGEKGEITLFNLLTHTAGLAPFDALYKKCRDYEDAIKFITEKKLQYKPGTQVVYSDFSFILLGYILEKIGGDRLDRLCSKFIFDPLGMKSTGFNPVGENIAATEINRQSGKPLIGLVHDENARFMGGISGHAGLFSNSDDLAVFVNMLINEGKAGEERFLSHSAYETMIRNYTAGLNEYRGLGWCIKGIGDKVSSGGELMSPSAFGHTGFTGTSIWVDLEKDVYVILLTNRVHPSRENNNIIRFRRVFHNAVVGALE